jgi:hypothetical protein
MRGETLQVPGDFLEPAIDFEEQEEAPKNNRRGGEILRDLLHESTGREEFVVPKQEEEHQEEDQGVPVFSEEKVFVLLTVELHPHIQECQHEDEEQKHWMESPHDRCMLGKNPSACQAYAGHEFLKNFFLFLKQLIYLFCISLQRHSS